MKKYYDLIGNKIPIENWVITYEDYKPTYPLIDDVRDMIAATPWPILWSHQIPRRLLDKQPDFPILLRDDPKIELPPWCHRPLLPWSETHHEKYLIRTPVIAQPKTILFLISTNVERSWESLCLDFPATEHKWVFLGHDPQSKVKFKNEISLSEIIYFHHYRPNLIVDLTFGILDTYTILHLFCLQRGVSMIHINTQKDYKIKRKMLLNQAEFMILD